MAMKEVAGSEPMSTIMIEVPDGERTFSKGKIMLNLAGLSLWARFKTWLDGVSYGGMSGWELWNNFLTFDETNEMFMAAKKSVKEYLELTDDFIETEILSKSVAE